MNDNETHSQSVSGEEDVFMILSHPIRRKMLQEMFEEGSISFTTLSKEWGLSTGVIYHHLKILSPLIFQENKKYALNEKGIEVCEWFLKTKKGKVTVEKISFFNEATAKLFFHLAEKKSKYAPIFLLAWVLSAYIATTHYSVIIGPIFFTPQKMLEPITIAIINTGALLIGYALIIVMTLLISKKKPPLMKILTGYLFSLTISIVSVIVASVFFSRGIVVSPIVLLVLLVVSQTFFVATLTLAITNYYSISIEKSVVTSILTLYVFLSLAFYLLIL